MTARHLRVRDFFNIPTPCSTTTTPVSVMRPYRFGFHWRSGHGYRRSPALRLSGLFARPDHGRWAAKNANGFRFCQIHRRRASLASSGVRAGSSPTGGANQPQPGHGEAGFRAVMSSARSRMTLSAPRTICSMSSPAASMLVISPAL